LSFYNVVFPGRLRLPYGEQSSESYNLSLYNIPALMNSHVIARAKAADEFRVLVIAIRLRGDGSWKTRIRCRAHQRRAARHLERAAVVAYNLGYPIMSLTKDLLVLDAAMRCQPDLVVWPVTLESFPRQKAVGVAHRPEQPGARPGAHPAFQLQLDPRDARWVEPDFIGQTIVVSGAPWRMRCGCSSMACRGRPRGLTRRFRPRSPPPIDFDEDVRWQDFAAPAPLTIEPWLLTRWRPASSGGGLPVLIVNEPMFISSGRNSHLRYNSLYPRWAYDAYRERLGAQARANGWRYLDLWDSVAPSEFTNTPVHLTPKGSSQMASESAPLFWYSEWSRQWMRKPCGKSLRRSSRTN